jgi:hypothetical protein
MVPEKTRNSGHRPIRTNPALDPRLTGKYFLAYYSRKHPLAY